MKKRFLFLVLLLALLPLSNVHIMAQLGYPVHMGFVELTPAESIVYKYVLAMDTESQETINDLYARLKNTGDKSLIKCTETGLGGWYVRKDYPLPEGNYFESDFYKSICEDLPQNAQVFYAELDGKIIAASIMLAANGRMNYHLSGSVREYATLAPTNLLLYQAALWGSANGYKTLYLGGGVGSGEDGLYRFKKSFYRADDLNQFYIGKKIFCPELYDELCCQRNIEENTSFFPQYRVNGN